MKKFFSKIKHKKVIYFLSIAVAIITLNIFTYPAYAVDSNNEVTIAPTNNNMIKMAKNNGLTPIKTASTKDYIEMNMYDYGTNINYNHLNKGVYNGFYTYPGFTQSKGQQAYDFSQYSNDVIKYFAADLLTNTGMYYLGDTIVKDLGTPTAVLAPNSYNNFTLNSSFDGTINNPLTNQMKKTLVNGYPAFDVNNLGTWTGSLDYLFSQNTYATKYGNLDGLFQYDEDTGLYYYSSRDNHAELVGSEFKVYNQIVTPDYMKYPFGNFLPFNSINTQTTQVSSITSSTLKSMKNSANSKSGSQYKKLANDLNAYDVAMTAYKGSNYTSWDTINLVLDVLEKNGNLKLKESTRTEFKNSLPNLYTVDYDEETNFFFGFDMKLNFMQTKDGMTGKNGDQKMVFRFEGDDDVWVYIEDYLFLDLSGIHGQVGGEIDFHDGVVRYYSFDKTTFSAGNTSAYLIDTVSFQEILGKDSNLLEHVGNGVYRFKEYSTPELRFYYMERGASSGVMTTMFNLPLVNEQAITVGKEVTSSSTVLGNPTYEFQVMKNGTTDQLFVGAGKEYDVYDSTTDTKLRSEIIDENGIITLHAGEYAIIDGIKENAGKYYVRELVEKSVASQYSNVTIDGKNTNFSTSTVTYNNKEYVYANSATKDMYDQVRVTNFINNANNSLAKLKIKKSLVNGTSSSIENMTFKIKVEIDGVPLAIGTKYKIGSTTYTVSEAGIINLKPTQEAVIENIFKNSTFKVEEVLDATSGLKDSYKLDGTAVNGEYVSGTVTSTSSVEVINAEAAGAYIDIPVSKTTTNPDGIKYTYTFTLKDSDANKIITSKTITVDENGNGSNNSLFTIEYSRLQHQKAETIHNYQIYEEKKTTLGSTVVNNDNYTTYDESVYDVAVKVTNNSNGFNATISSIKVNGENKQNIVFNNKRLASLTISKTVESSKQDVNTKFNFEVESTGLADGSYKTSSGTVNFQNGKATVSLSHNESITIYGLPYGSKYNVTETNGDGFVTKYKVDSNNIIEGNKVTNVTLQKKSNSNSTFGYNYDTKISFVNVQGYELPKTGSSGKLLIIFIGTILMSIFPIYTLRLKKEKGEI